MDYLIRFVVGGFVVSAFAVIGDDLRPKSFAGLFGAAPSVALATLSLAIWKEGAGYVSIEGRSMILGALRWLHTVSPSARFWSVCAGLPLPRPRVRSCFGLPSRSASNNCSRS